MAEDEGARTEREKRILARWHESADQLRRTAEATGSGELTVANSDQELTARRVRLRRHHVDLEGIVNRDESLWVSFLSGGLAAARAVGRVVTARSPARPSQAVGTGALIGPRLLITNNHVVESAGDAARMGVQFGYEFGDDGSDPRPSYCLFEPDRFFVTDAELDFTVVAVADLDGVPPGDTYGVVPLIEQTGKAVKAEFLNVIHHPGGDPKRISIRENQMVAQDDLWLRYRSDARRGSSGAPVFNDQWEMVALHHGGIPVRDESGADLDQQGQRWTPDMGAENKAYSANEGARVSRIVHRLRAADLSAEARELIDQALDKGANR
jgi:V8-like Glu-specific endopeptidase